VSPFDEEPAVSADEAAAAERLAAALERGGAEADTAAVAAALLLQTAGQVADEVAVHRLRAELTGAIRLRSARRRVAIRLAAAAVILTVLGAGVLLVRGPRHPLAATLDAREQEARVAVSRIAEGWDADTLVLAHVTARLDSEWRSELTNQVRASRFSELVDRTLDESLTSHSTAAPRPTRAAPTPGGVS
jgi:hypothetical protein